jgi:hypothetical protein
LHNMLKRSDGAQRRDGVTNISKTFQRWDEFRWSDAKT